MSTKHLIAGGIGFSPGTLSYFVTLGLGNFAGSDSGSGSGDSGGDSGSGSGGSSSQSIYLHIPVRRTTNTAVSICSNALVKLGDDPITSLLDNTNRARHCNRLFDPTRQAVLRDAPWNDSTARIKLAQSTDSPPWEYDYMYALPVDYMRMVKTSLDETDEDYKIEGRFLLTNASEVYIAYVYDNEDISTYDSLHVDALTARMAYELANSITAKLSLSDRMHGEYDKKIKDAKGVDGQEGSHEINDISPLCDVRY